ncbi:hypothetical protein FVR03_09600 [Pontibacter qinzhouensis]|uniref:Uncharacterized protein n=2 Tax=Pontibacter qinzhouensis TaxID=2603253 RepID=A0A5C8KBS4_9BACT|nr:hypothetical protein FVR03_09600 [Pontibacter qinzhouensis]
MESDSRNFRKGEKLFAKYYEENGNAFMYSVGTVGYKYIWTITSSEIIMTSIDLKGKTDTLRVKSIGNWTQHSGVNFEEPNCSMVLDGDVLILKFKNEEGQELEKSLINEIDCLEKSNSPILVSVLNDMKSLKIK